jgi:hypothetical protein
MPRKSRRLQKLEEAARLAKGLEALIAKYAIPVESGPRKKVLRHAPLDTPDDAGAHYGSNWGLMF